MSHRTLRTEVKHLNIVRHERILLFTEFAEKSSFELSESDQKSPVEPSLSRNEG